MTFYDFCRCVRLEKISASKTKNTATERLGVLTRHELKHGHPLAVTHRLIEHTSEIRGEGTNLLIPRVVGMSIPRKSDKKYPMFAVAHFIPFCIDKPFPGPSTTETFNSIEFSPQHLQIMDNEQAKESRAMTRALHGAIESGDVTNIDLAKTGNRKSRDVQAELLVNVMRECHWVSNERKEHGKEAFDGDERQYPEPTSSQLSAWLASIKRQENEVMAKRRNAANPSLIQPSAADTTYVPATEALNQKCELSSVTESVHAVAEEFGLNEKQRIVYNIVARKFVDGHILKVADSGRPLRMLMTGPGGTGKTHAVRALQRLMALHNLQHLIRFLGPTGSSAKQIGGTTIHKGLGLSIALKSKGRGNRKP